MLMEYLKLTVLVIGFNIQGAEKMAKQHHTEYSGTPLSIKEMFKKTWFFRDMEVLRMKIIFFYLN